MCLNKLEKYAPYAVVPLRVVVGLAFVFHGYGKLFGGIAGTAGFFASVGIPAAMFFAWVVALIEFFGGIALVLGLFTRYAAGLLSVVMLVAIFKVHLAKGFSGPGGYELPLVYLAGTLALFLRGAGVWSLERVLFKKEC